MYFCNAVVNVRVSNSPQGASLTTGKWKHNRAGREDERVLSTVDSSRTIGETRSTWDGFSLTKRKRSALPRKEVIQPHLPVRLPCYDFTPITDPTLDACLSHSELAQRLEVLPTFVV